MVSGYLIKNHLIKTADRKELVTFFYKNTYEQPTPRGALEMLKIKERTEKC